MMIIFRIITAIFATKLSISGFLFLLGPIVFGTDYAISSSMTQITVYSLISVKLFAEIWIIATIINLNLMQHQFLSRIIITLVVFSSSCHLFFLSTQTSLNEDMYLLEAMKGDSIETIFLMIFYAILIHLERKKR